MSVTLTDEERIRRVLRSANAIGCRDEFASIICGEGSCLSCDADRALDALAALTRDPAPVNPPVEEVDIEKLAIRLAEDECGDDLWWEGQTAGWQKHFVDKAREYLALAGVGHFKPQPAPIAPASSQPIDQAGLLAKKEGCVFCEIVSGAAQADIVRRWGDAVAFVPIGPVVPGHLLVVPHAHVDDARTDSETTGLAFRRASELAGQLGGDFNLIANAGPAAGQTVFHLHVHIVPRLEGDGLRLPWTPVEPAPCQCREVLKILVPKEACAVSVPGYPSPCVRCRSDAALAQPCAAPGEAGEPSKAERLAQSIAAVHGLELPLCGCGHGEHDHYRDGERVCGFRRECRCEGYRRRAPAREGGDPDVR